MANITLSIDDDLLKRSRSYAQAIGTTLNALVRDSLQRRVDAAGTVRDLAASFARTDRSHTGSGGRKIRREEAYER